MPAKTKETTEQARIWARTQAIEDAAAAEGRMFTPDEEAELEQLAFELRIETERVAKEEQETAKERQRADKMRADLLRAAFNPGGQRDAETPLGEMIAAGEPRSYAALFGQPSQMQAAKWKRGEFLRCVMNNWYDSRLQPMAAMGENTGSAGGLMVPMHLEPRMIDKMLHKSIMMSHASISPMASQQALIAGFSGSDQSTTMHGFSFTWLTENQTVTPGSGTVRGIKLEAWLGGIYLDCSNELIADGVGFETALMDSLGESMGESLDYFFLQGDGVAKPLGLINAPGAVEVAKEGAQAADSILLDNITKMYAACTNPEAAIWIVNPSCIPQLAQLSFSIVSGGPAEAGSSALRQSADGSMTMLSRPLLTTSRLPVLGDAGDIVFADLSGYAIGLRQGIAIESSPHVSFTSNVTTFRSLVRVDGRPLHSSSYTGRDGASYSQIVTLAERA